MPTTCVDLLEMLWQISWQASIVALLVLLLRAALGRVITSRWQHLLWSLVLLRLMMPVLPTSRISIFSFEHFSPARGSNF